MNVESLYQGKLLVYPPQGTLLVCTDLHGNLEDFHAMRDIFYQSLTRDPDTYLLFTGDLIHGPAIHPREWDEKKLGDYYYDKSDELVDEIIALKEDHPHRVHFILGNHEHSHIGGPHTGKFHRDETVFFEDMVGPLLAQDYNDFFRTFALIALTPCGVVFTHGAPKCSIRNLDNLSRVDYDDYEHLRVSTIVHAPIVGELLWSRQATAEEARKFLVATMHEKRANHLVVFGHAVVREGYQKRGEEQMVLSTSFGLVAQNKFYLRLNLGQEYNTVHDLEEGRELMKLYP